MPVSPSSKRGKNQVFREIDTLSGYRLIMFIVIFSYLALLIYAFTPYTHNLDDIKVSILYAGGPFLLLFYLFFAAKGYMRIFPLVLLIPVAGYSFILLISTLFAGKNYSWIGWIQQGFQLSLLGGFFCCFGLMRSKKDISRVIFYFTVIGLGTAVFGLFHYFGGFSLLYKIIYGTKESRAPLAILFLTFSHAKNNMFSTILSGQRYAGFLVMLLPLSVGYSIVEVKSHFRQYVAIASSILMAACLYLAQSKASTGATAVIVVVFLFLYTFFADYKKIRIPHLWIWIAGFLIIALTLGFFTLDVSSEKFKSAGRSVASRTIIWSGAWNLFKYGPGPENWYEIENPPFSIRSLLIGCGPGTFRVIFPRYRNADYHLHDISNVTLFSHNRFLDLLSENGIFGFIFYMWIIIAFFFLGMKQLLKSGDCELRVYSIAFMCSILSILLLDFLHPNSRWAIVGASLWAILGFGFGAFSIKKAGKIVESSSVPLPTFSFPLPSRLKANILLGLILILAPAVFLCARFGQRRFSGARYNNNGLTFSKIGENYAKQEKKYTQMAQSGNYKTEDVKPYISQARKLKFENYRNAIDSFKKALEYNPYFITTYYKLAHSYNSIGDIENSVKAYRELQKFAPDYSEIHFNLGIVSSAIARNYSRDLMEANSKEKREEITGMIKEMEDQSLREFKIAAKMSNKSLPREMYARRLSVAKKYDEAIKVYQFLHKIEPGNNQYLNYLAWLEDKTDPDE
jgi:O-antigen ligase/polysaccharide polymerase Wzy-like membrane protein/tetratricopeptide repeat protein